jgi:hypothetical protein
MKVETVEACFNFRTSHVKRNKASKKERKKERKKEEK